MLEKKMFTGICILKLFKNNTEMRHQNKSFRNNYLKAGLLYTVHMDTMDSGQRVFKSLQFLFRDNCACICL